YYWAQIYLKQLTSGDVYHKLEPTVSICFTEGTLFPNTAEWHQAFRLQDAATRIILTNRLATHLIEVPKFTRALEELATPLEAWCWFLRHAGTLDKEHLPVQLVSSPPMARALEVLTMMSQSEIERERYEARLKHRRDQAMLLDDAKETGLQE